MCFHVLLSACAVMLSMAVHGIDWKYDVSGRDGLFVKQNETVAVMSNSYDARSFAVSESEPVVIGSRLFDARSYLTVEKCNFTLTFDPIPLWIILR